MISASQISVFHQEGGQCNCKANVDGRQCEKCKAGYYNLQAVNPKGCDNCDCHTAGTVNANISCHATTGDCFCKANVRSKTIILRRHILTMMIRYKYISMSRYYWLSRLSYGGYGFLSHASVQVLYMNSGI